MCIACQVGGMNGLVWSHDVGAWPRFFGSFGHEDKGTVNILFFFFRSGSKCQFDWMV